MKHYNIILHSITPLIIHTGKQYSALEIMKLKNLDTVVLVDLEKVFSTMNDSERNKYFTPMDFLNGKPDNDKQKLLQARSLIQIVVLNNSDVIITKAKANPKFTEEIEGNPQANICAIFKDEVHDTPYIPGSTLKGLIRTAVLEHLRKNQQDKYPNYHVTRKDKPKKFAANDEMQIMKNSKTEAFEIGHDPFMFIKVSDLFFNTRDIQFDTVRVIGKNNQAKDIPIYTEMMGSEYTHKVEYIAKGTVTIDDKRLDQFTEKNKYGDFINIEMILKSVQQFFTNILQNKKHPIPNTIAESIKMKCDSKPNKVPLRIGRFTQIESKIFKLKRNDENPKDINIYSGVSRSLIGGELPAGWCVMEVVE